MTTLNRDRISKRSRVICPVEVSDRIVVHVAGDGISADAAVLLVDGRVVAVDRVAIVDGISIVAGIKTVSEKNIWLILCNSSSIKLKSFFSNFFYIAADY